MKVQALRTVYSRSEGKEYQKGQSFEATEREARVWMKLRKVAAAENADVAPAAKPSRPTPATPRQLSTAAMKAEDVATPQAVSDKSPRRYLRRDLLPED